MNRIVAVAAMFLTAASVRAEAPSQQETTAADQVDIAVTAYNNGLALVRDVRRVTLPQGESALLFADVAERVRPQTVGVRSLAREGSVALIEQNYEYDLISPAKLMEKYVGQAVKLVNFSEDIGFTTVDAVLLSNNNGPVYEVEGRIYLGHPGTVVMPEIPDNLIAKPSLMWLLNNQQADQELEVTYLTEGMTWQADYVVTLARDDASLDLNGWVTMNNQTGATYENARLKLVAGDVNIVREMPMAGGFGGPRSLAAMEAPPMPQQEAFAEFHLYTMPRRTTIRQNQSKQLALLSATDVASTKLYELRGQSAFYSQQMPQLRDQKVDVFIEFRNSEENNLGEPLPAGVMRIYQQDSEGMLQFAGEDRVQHTPRNEEVRLRMGTAFDIVADRTQTEFRIIGNNVYESAFEIELRNHKDSDVVVDVVEPMSNDWRILTSSHEYTQRDARTAVFSIPVPADGEATLTYRVQVRTQ